MRRTPKAAFLPLYLKLYDDSLPAMREVLDAFADEVAAALEGQGVEVVRAPVCRVEREFRAAMDELEKAEPDALVTLHLAYSPSLESAAIIAESDLPVVVLDTTPDATFGLDTDPARILYNHGIHGVQDLTCMLRRLGKDYEIVAGAFQNPTTLARTADLVRAAAAAKNLRNTRALRIGPAFAGMGDFFVDEKVLADELGIEVTEVDPSALVPVAEGVSDADVAAEMAADRAQFDGDIDDEVLARSERVGLALHRYLEEGEYDAFSANFLAFDDADGPINAVPFLGISKAMATGVGYAGEGDVLTAALVGALLSFWDETTFTEIFCADWEGGSIFLSHMGEINPDVAAAKPRLCEKDYHFTAARNPVVIAAAPKAGEAVFVNLAPGPDDTFRLILAPVTMLEDGTHPAMQEVVRGWMRPRLGTAEFLEAFSRLGGTHHSALVLGDHLEALMAFAGFAGMECCLIA